MITISKCSLVVMGFFVANVEILFIIHESAGDRIVLSCIWLKEYKNE